MHDTPPIEWDRASGSSVWDTTGKKYIDFTSGIFVANVGHCNPIVEGYIKAQLDNKLWFSFAFPTKIRKEFIDELIGLCPDHLNSCCVYSEGSIANEAAIKIAKRHTGKNEIVSYAGSYHGNTCMLMNLGLKIPFPLEEQGFEEHALLIDPAKTAAIIIEGYQGWAAYFYPLGYIKEMEKWCRDNNVLLMVDEIQSGFGRTGKLFCFQHYGIEPDIIVFGKGASSSLPLSGVIGRREIMDAMDGVELISNTHSGNCLSMAAGLGSLKALQMIDLGNVLLKGEMMLALLEGIKRKNPEHIKEIRGKGLLAAIHFHDKDLCDRVTLRCIEKGLMLVRTRKGTVKIGPPLMIAVDDLRAAISIISEALGECLQSATSAS